LAVLASSVQRPASASYTSRTSSARKRRIVAGALVLCSLALVSVYFREAEGGSLHDAQGIGATVLRPFQVGAERVARPFRDVYGYFAGLVRAKSELEELRRDYSRLSQQAIQNETARQRLGVLERLQNFRAPPSYPRDFRAVTAAVVSVPTNPYDQEVVIEAGSSDGIRRDDPVLGARGLVGRVTRVTPHQALVMLLTDESSSVSATVLRSPTGAFGLVEPSQAGSVTLALERVTKAEVVREGAIVVTAGRRQGEESSIYPGGIEIGVVASVAQNSSDLYKRIEVRPFADLSSLSAAVVLVSKRPRGPSPK